MKTMSLNSVMCSLMSGLAITAACAAGETCGEAKGEKESPNGARTQHVLTALEFDGVDDQVVCGDMDDIEGLSGLTIAAWAKPSVPKREGHIASRGTVQFWVSRRYGGSVSFKLETDKGWQEVVSGRSSVNLSGQAWTHLAGVYDGKTMKVYINGVEGASARQTGTTIGTDRKVALGNVVPEGQEFYKGLLCDIRMYERALSSEEIREIVSSRSGDDIEAGLVGRWLCDGRKSDGSAAEGEDFVEDISGRDNHGTPTGSPVHRVISGKHAF